MSLTGWPLLGALIALAVGSLMVTLGAWRRLASPGKAAAGQRVAVLLACQLSMVLLLLVVVNDHFGLYSSWTDLGGGYANQPQAEQAVRPTGLPVTPSGGPSPAPSIVVNARDVGRAHPESWHGDVSGVTATVWVWLPPQYNDPRNAHTKFPVLEAFPGYPGSPSTWVNKLKLTESVEREIAAGRMRPTIVVVPAITVAPPRDTECTDVPGGPKAETWLTTDIHRGVEQRYRASMSARDWGTIGYSTGGFCAIKLTLRHPELFGSAASLAGYFHPSSDATTGTLFADKAARDASDPMWLLAHRPAAGQSFFLMGSREDAGTVPALQAFAAGLRPPDSADELILAHGGHNPGVWTSALPKALGFFDRQFAQT